MIIKRYTTSIHDRKVIENLTARVENQEASVVEMRNINDVGSVIEMSREDFDLLSVEQEAMYHIVEEDGSITIKKGVNM